MPARLYEIAPDSVFTSVVCVTELRSGARRRPGAQALWERIAREVLSRLRILPFGEREALRAGDLLADLEAADRRSAQDQPADGTEVGRYSSAMKG